MIQEINSTGFMITMTIILLLLCGVIIAFVYIHKIRQLDYIKELQNIGIQTKESTCKFISREIHDNVLQKLTSSLNILQRLNPQDNVTQKLVSTSINELSQTIQSLHDISEMLSTNKISSKSLRGLIEEELNIMRIQEFNIVFNLVGSAKPINIKIEEAIIRIIQESFRNISKHSAAKNIRVILVYNTFQLDLFISDDGKGFDSILIRTNSKGNGLRNMRERAKEVGGAISLSSISDYGTDIHLQIPINYE